MTARDQGRRPPLASLLRRAFSVARSWTASLPSRNSPAATGTANRNKVRENHPSPKEKTVPSAITPAKTSTSPAAFVVNQKSAEKNGNQSLSIEASCAAFYPILAT